MPVRRAVCLHPVQGPGEAVVTLNVWTSRITYRGADRLDVTRKSAGPEGLSFAPSWAILRPMLELRRSDDPHAELRAWPQYVADYTAEMRTSYRDHRPSWDVLLAKSEVTLLCYCTDADHCHRTVLAEILGKLGAEVHGEREKPNEDWLREKMDGLNDRQLDLLSERIDSELAMRRGKLS